MKLRIVEVWYYHTKKTLASRGTFGLKVKQDNVAVAPRRTTSTYFQFLAGECLPCLSGLRDVEEGSENVANLMRYLMGRGA
jgi:hypothetical protein